VGQAADAEEQIDNADSDGEDSPGKNQSSNRQKSKKRVKKRNEKFFKRHLSQDTIPLDQMDDALRAQLAERVALVEGLDQTAMPAEAS